MTVKGQTLRLEVRFLPAQFLSTPCPVTTGLFFFKGHVMPIHKFVANLSDAERVKANEIHEQYFINARRWCDIFNRVGKHEYDCNVSFLEEVEKLGDFSRQEAVKACEEKYANGTWTVRWQVYHPLTLAIARYVRLQEEISNNTTGNEGCITSWVVTKPVPESLLRKKQTLEELTKRYIKHAMAFVNKTPLFRMDKELHCKQVPPDEDFMLSVERHMLSPMRFMLDDGKGKSIREIIVALLLDKDGVYDIKKDLPYALRKMLQLKYDADNETMKKIADKYVQNLISFMFCSEAIDKKFMEGVEAYFPRSVEHPVTQMEMRHIMARKYKDIYHMGWETCPELVSMIVSYCNANNRLCVNHEINTSYQIGSSKARATIMDKMIDDCYQECDKKLVDMLEVLDPYKKPATQWSDKTPVIGNNPLTMPSSVQAVERAAERIMAVANQGSTARQTQEKINQINQQIASQYIDPLLIIGKPKPEPVTPKLDKAKSFVDKWFPIYALMSMVIIICLSMARLIQGGTPAFYVIAMLSCVMGIGIVLNGYIKKSKPTLP